MSEASKARRIANAMAADAASYIVKAPPDQREAALLGAIWGFRDACNERGVPVDHGDLTYYGGIITATVRVRMAKNDES